MQLGHHFNVQGKRSAMLHRIRRLESSAVIHGDVHGGNILVCDRTPIFIDFQYSGPGNPFIDLVRLDSCVRLKAMRALGDLQELTRLYEGLYLRGQTCEELEKAHPAIFRSCSCRLAIDTAVGIRKAALNLAGAHAATIEDYLAVVGVLAAHNLVEDSPSSVVEKACLQAILMASL